MARKRKTSRNDAGGKGGAQKQSKPRGVDRSDASVKKWDRREDIPQDGEDLFHAGRDEILLDGSDARRNAGDFDSDDEEEVFALKGLPESDEDEYGNEAEDDDDEEEQKEEPAQSSSKKDKSKSKSKATKVAEEDESGDESDESEERWGKNKSAYYSSNAKDIDSDDEETRDMEEAEARRLQAKAREAVTEDDFGLDVIQDVPEDEIVPEVVPPIAQDKASLLRHLERTSPETLALAREWEDVARDLYRLEAAMKAVPDDSNSSAADAEDDQVSLGMLHLHHQTLLAYATTLAYYLHVRATPVAGPTASSPTTARPVPPKVLERLLELKHSLSILEDLGFGAIGDSDSEDGEEGDSEEEEGVDYDSEKHGLTPSEMDEILAELQGGKYRDDAMSEDDDKPKRAKGKKTKVAEATTSKPKGSKSKDKGKTKVKKDTPAKPIFDLVEPTFVPTKIKSTSTTSDSATAFGDPTALEFGDAADKKSRRKTLRFHTSRIEGASKRREGARAGALGGDDDLPWRDMRREKQSKADAAAKEGRGGGGDDLEGEGEGLENEKKGKKRAREEEAEADGDAEGDDGYYELVKRQKKDAKAEKKAAYEAERAANAPDFSEDGPDGPRHLTRAILKNRGMTPRRSKAVRNPRVKKKLRFEKAKKAVGSKKAVFKGGLGGLPGGRYEGEQSGISNVVKSVRL